MENKLILKGIKWIMENTLSNGKMAFEEKCEIFDEINEVLNPKITIGLEDKTKDALSESDE